VGQPRERLTLGRLLEDAVARFGPREALVFEDRRLRYAELGAEVRRLARGLVGAGVVKGARVAMLLPSSPEAVVSLFAVAAVGAVGVPLNTFAPIRELSWILRHADVSLLLMQPRLLGHAWLEDLLAAHPELGSATPGRIRCPALPSLRRIFCLGLEAPRGAVEPWSELLAAGHSVPDALLEAIGQEVLPTDDGLLIYTSGSTGTPKGVLHRQRAAAIQSYRFAEQLRLTPEDRVWTAQPFFWTAGLCMSLGATLAAGACLLLQDHFEAGAALELMEQERATTAHAWAHQHKALGEHPSAGRRDLSSLSKLPPTSPLARIAGIQADTWGPQGAYGLTETFTIAASIPSDAPAELRRSTSGRALPGVEIRVVDPESGQPLAPGQAGELAVRGVTLMCGYAKRLPEEVLDAAGFFRTGDGGWIDEEGYLYWTGRLGDMIKTGGANVSPQEIERALEGFEGLLAARAVGIPHPTLGEVVVLCAVPRAGDVPSEEALRQHLRQRLSSFKVPRCVLFFAASELELTGNQKIRLAPLRAAALARLEAEQRDIAGHRYGAAQPGDAR